MMTRAESREPQLRIENGENCTLHCIALRADIQRTGYSNFTPSRGGRGVLGLCGVGTVGLSGACVEWDGSGEGRGTRGEAASRMIPTQG